MDNHSDPLTFIIIVSVVILVFWAIRELVLWYFKIGVRLDQQKKQTELLTLIYIQSGGEIIESDGKSYSKGFTILLIHMGTGEERRIDYMDYKRREINNTLGKWKIKEID